MHRGRVVRGTVVGERIVRPRVVNKKGKFYFYFFCLWVASRQWGNLIWCKWIEALSGYGIPTIHLHHHRDHIGPRSTQTQRKLTEESSLAFRPLQATSCWFLERVGSNSWACFWTIACCRWTCSADILKSQNFPRDFGFQLRRKRRFSEVIIRMRFTRLIVELKVWVNGEMLTEECKSRS